MSYPLETGDFVETNGHFLGEVVRGPFTELLRVEGYEYPQYCQLIRIDFFKYNYVCKENRRSINCEQKLAILKVSAGAFYYELFHERTHLKVLTREQVAIRIAQREPWYKLYEKERVLTHASVECANCGKLVSAPSWGVTLCGSECAAVYWSDRTNG